MQGCFHLTQRPCPALQAEAEALARSLPGVAALLSVTVPANGTMRRIFARRGLCQLCQVVSWPPYAVAREVHGQLTRAPAAGEEAARRPASLLDALPNAAALLQNGPAARLLPLWRRCETRSELEAALLQLRQPRMGAVGEAAGDPQAPGAADQQPCAASNALHWLPEEFDLLPAGSAQAEALVRQGQVWLLPAGAVAAASGEAAVQMQDEQRQAGGQHDMPAVLVLHGPGVWGMQHAGVVAASQAALESALLLAAEVEPHCCWCARRGGLGWAVRGCAARGCVWQGGSTLHACSACTAPAPPDPCMQRALSCPPSLPPRPACMWTAASALTTTPCGTAWRATAWMCCRTGRSCCDALKFGQLAVKEHQHSMQGEGGRDDMQAME